MKLCGNEWVPFQCTRAKRLHNRSSDFAMACTTKPLSPESRKPLHTQVTNLREERVSLLETIRALNEDKDTITKQLQKASERITELQQQLDESEAAKAQAIDEQVKANKEASMKDALASQLRIEATQWQGRCEQGEAERSRKAAEDEISQRREKEFTESERFRLMAELASANAERKAADEQWRRTTAEAASTHSLIEMQRDEAVARACRAEETLASAMSEQTQLNEALSRLARQSADEKQVIEARASAAEVSCRSQAIHDVVTRRRAFMARQHWHP